MEHNLSAKQVQELSGPGVYLYKHRGRVLYVGASAHGLGRAFGPNHIMKRYTEPLQLTFIPCATANEAFELEIKLIAQHCPDYNAKNTGGKGMKLEPPKEVPAWMRNAFNKEY